MPMREMTADENSMRVAAVKRFEKKVTHSAHNLVLTFCRHVFSGEHANCASNSSGHRCQQDCSHIHSAPYYSSHQQQRGHQPVIHS
eukprot:CCRYP_010315-RA/>CCRYP_010315-RA protein AED:0.37 eAED:0.88 QI:40/0/0.5/1/0/0/2/0/85